MIKKIICVVLVIMMIFTGCGKTISYKYIEAESQGGDWLVKNGRISIREGDDFIKFKITYIGDELIEEGEQWICTVLIRKNSKESPIDEEIFTQIDIYGKEMDEGDTKVVETDNNVINIENDYDFSSVYLKIEYTKENEAYEDIIELSLKR